MNVKTISTTSLDELKIQIRETVENEFQPTLAVCFASLQCDLEQLTAVTKAHDIDLIGSSTAGEIHGEGISAKSISIMLTDIDPSAYHIVHEKANYAASLSVGRRIAQASPFTNSAYILVFSLTVNGENLTKGITETETGRPPIFGGMAGDDMAMRETFTFTNEQISSDGVTVLILDNDKISVEGLALCGWQPIGTENVITSADENIIYRINDEPALNVVKSYFGDYFENGVSDDSVPLGAAQYPLQIKRDESYVLRATMQGNEEDGSLVMAGSVREGDRFHFSVAPGFEIIEETIEGFQNFAAEREGADAVLMFSCVARHMSLGPLIEDEVAGVYGVWNKPMIGFFSYGEVGQHKDNVSQYYNETCSLVLLREK